MTKSPLPSPKSHNKQTITRAKTALAIATALALPAAHAATFNVTESIDNGTGLVANTLSWAILQANTTMGADTIELNTDVTITGVMKRLIDSDTTLQSDAIRRTINGNSQFRPLFVKSGQVMIQGVDITNGRAQGGGSSTGGRGAGLGGGIFIYDGDVTLSESSISYSTAVGGVNSGASGGGGLFGSSSAGGGGLFANGIGAVGGYGGYGNYRTTDLLFGEGGNYGNADGFEGGFGGGGGYGYYGNGGAGGFGAGGGYSYYENGGAGGFGGGAGFSSYNSSGSPGYAANQNNGAGLGGGVFVRSGNLSLQSVSFDYNYAFRRGSGNDSSKGLGGALFVMHTTQNSNGNNQGMPPSLPNVSGCGVNFSNNEADSDSGQSSNNDNIFDLAGRITPDNNISLTHPCGPLTPEIQVEGSGVEIIDGDITPSITDNTDFGSINQDDVITQFFEIRNIGNLPLNLTRLKGELIEINGDNQFIVVNEPLTNQIGPNQSESFAIGFLPNQPGIATAQVLINNDDPDENTYEFTIMAEALALVPEMAVSGNDIEINDGDLIPSLNDNTEFGSYIIEQETVTKTFTISNDGNNDLQLLGMPMVSLLNNNGQFEVTSQPKFSSLGPKESLNFEITFTPTSEGVDSVTVMIENNDSDENPYDFMIQAEGIVPPPEIDLYGDTFGLIADGDVTPSSEEGTYFGEAQENAQSITRTFYIDNFSGLGDLILDGNPVIELQNNSGQFAVTALPESSVITPGNFTTFGITFTPTSIGTDTATVVIQNNDPDEAPYDFVIEAEGVEQAGIIQVYENGTPVDGFDFVFFDYVPVNNGQSFKTLEVKNIGFAPIEVSNAAISQSIDEFSIVQNISDFVLDPDESTFISVQYDPVFTGFTGPAVTLDFGYGNTGDFYNVSLYGYGQPTLTINAQNNYLQEGETAVFTVTSDVVPNNYTEFNWQLSGQVTPGDFTDGVVGGTGFVNGNSPSYDIEVPTNQDGFYEGPEIFNISISSVGSRANIGFPSVSGGVIDDDFIFDDGFELADLNQVLAGIAKYAFDSNDVPTCNSQVCHFLNRSLSFEAEFTNVLDILAWFEETLSLFQASGDWDGDGLPNHHDLNPFGLDNKLIEKIILKE